MRLPKHFNPGCVPDPPDERDIKLEEVMGAVQLPEEYNIIEEVGGINVEHQGTSGSCVGQGWAYYTEVLERIENKNYTNLSARDIYSQIFLPGSGAHIRDGAKIVTEKGVGLESQIPSYKDGLPPDEEFMRQRGNLLLKWILGALEYKSKSYATIFHSNNIELVKQAIFQNHGVVSGVRGSNAEWSNPPQSICIPPEEPKWAHCIFLTGWKGDFVRFINSWGEGWASKGHAWLAPTYFKDDNVFNLWSLVDLPNDWQKPMYKLIKDSANRIWVVNNGMRFWILDPETLTHGINGLWLGWGDIQDDDPAKYEFGGVVVLAKPDDPIK